MNQTQKRLSIIKLAISITDIETIQLQISKLRLLKTDMQIQKIIEALETESYALAQTLIQEYIDTPVQEVHQRTADTKTTYPYTAEEQKLIDEFDLFILENDKASDNEPIDVNQYMQDTASALDISDVPNNEQDLAMKEPEPAIQNSELKRRKEDTFYEDQPLQSEPSSDSLYAEEQQQDNTIVQTDDSAEEDLQTKPSDTAQETTQEEQTETTSVQIQKPMKSWEDPKSENVEYPPIFSIKQQFLQASQKYQLLENGTSPQISSTAWMNQISDQKGYTKQEVEEVVTRAMKLSQSDVTQDLSEAGELILLSGLTENEFGQLIFARELYKGKLLQRNIDEAFQRIEELAAKEYPEAICDLGQFYEHGISTKKDKKQARELYQKAMHLGIKRAQKHFERLKKEGSLFSF